MKNIFKVLSIISIFSIGLYGSSLRISADELVKQKQNSIILIDSRDKISYEAGHIDGALNFPALNTFESLDKNGKIINPVKFGKIARKLGLNINDKIVVYDGGSFFNSSRLFWTLEVYGFKNVKLLSDSYNYWEDKDYPISIAVKDTIKSDYIPTIDNTKLATKFSTQIAIKNPTQIIIDARGNKGYRGEVSTAVRFGHIPKAINLPAQHNINKKQDGSQSLHSIADLEKIYSKLDKKKKVIIYCEVGKLSSTNYFVMRELGFNVSNYDSSWKEWGNEFYLPIIKPKKSL